MDKFNYNRDLTLAAFSRIDEYTDSFEFIRDVKSELLFGDMTIAKNPWLSVVIPTYRRGTLFGEALRSALAQETVTFSWEIVVVDNTPLDENGSTHGLRLVRELNDARVLYYHNRENIGSGYNWNRGVELARGKWVFFLHDDDILLPHALEHVERLLCAYHGKRQLGYLHARRVEFSDGEIIDPAVEARRYPIERLSRFGVLIGGCTGAGAPTCGTAILRQAYLETGGINYDFGPSADAALCYQIMRDYEVITSDRVLGGYRWGKNETLKKESLLRMITADELLSRYTYEQTRFSCLWGTLFGAASSWRNIWQKKRIASRYGIEITETELGTASAYPKPGWLNRTFFLGFYAFYRFCRLVAGLFRELGCETKLR